MVTLSLNNQQSLYKDIFQCVRIRPHSPTLTNLENSTGDFRQSAQICCREEQKEEKARMDYASTKVNSDVKCTFCNRQCIIHE